MARTPSRMMGGIKGARGAGQRPVRGKCASTASGWTTTASRAAARLPQAVTLTPRRARTRPGPSRPGHGEDFPPESPACPARTTGYRSTLTCVTAQQAAVTHLPPSIAGWRRRGLALPRLNAGRASPALLHATPRGAGCRLHADHGRLGARAGGTLGRRRGWHRPGRSVRLSGPQDRRPYRARESSPRFPVREPCPGPIAGASTPASPCRPVIEGCTLNKASASFRVGKRRRKVRTRAIRLARSHSQGGWFILERGHDAPSRFRGRHRQTAAGTIAQRREEKTGTPRPKQEARPPFGVPRTPANSRTQAGRNRGF